MKKNGATKGCKGCSWVIGKYHCFIAHDDNCRKRFIELSDEPDHYDSKERIDKEVERMTRNTHRIRRSSPTTQKTMTTFNGTHAE